MKKNLFILATLLGTLAFQSCDYVADPRQTTEGGGGSDSTVHERRVLVEDYTGHKCTACPAAAVAAEQLVDNFGDKVIVVAVHAGFFATPTPPAGAPPSSYLADFRTAAGTTYDGTSYFGISNMGNPNGMVNRKDYTPSTTTHIKAYTSWATEVSGLLAYAPVADLTITNTYNSVTRSLSTNLVSEFISDTLLTGTYKLVVMLTQDSIVDYQLDGTTHVPNYVFDHVLRDNLNGTWGDTLVSGTITPYAQITKNYVYTLPATYPIAGGATSTACVDSKCHVVAFIYNTANYEIIQAAEAKVIE